MPRTGLRASRRVWRPWLAILLIAGAGNLVLAAGRGEPGPIHVTRVELGDVPADLKLFRAMDLDVDGVFDGWARVYLTREELQKLERLGYGVSVLPPQPIPPPSGPKTPGQDGIPTQYHTYATLTSELDAIATAHPDLVRLSSIGQSVAGRELWMMKISDNPDVAEDEPGVAYIAAMHGDEVVGKELCIELINYLLDNYGTDPRVTDLVNESEIWIMPSVNPDGTELVQRYNANGFDLNRNFPDWFADPVNTPAGRPIEIQAIMTWAAAHSVTILGSYHGGALVANYPWDNNPSGSSTFSPTPDPDHAALESVSLTYAENNPPMYASSSFPNGVTNGAAWYAISGGVQDWSYAWYGNFAVTLEISDVKWPAASTLPTFWNENLESMLSYFERAQEGLRGIVTDTATAAPVAAEVRLDSNPFAVYADPDAGDYHRIVLPGSYTMDVTAPGYFPQTVPVTVLTGPAVRYDVALQPRPADLQPIAASIDDGPAGNGWLEPDETAELAMTLKNLGAQATSVGGRLIATGWYADVVQAEATFPDLVNQATGESNAPHYTIHVDPAVPAGHKIGVAVDWAADQGAGVSEPLFLDVGGISCDTTAATDVPQAILDYQTFTSEIVVAAGTEIDEVRVPIDLSHTFIGDLVLKLTSPQGTAVLLHSRTGSGTNDIVGTYGVDLTSHESLSAFADEPAGGKWTLEVSDLAGGDTGTLNAWSLEICGRAAEATPPEMRFRDTSVEPGGVLLRWWSYPGLTSYRVYRSTDPGSVGGFSDVTAEDGDPTDTSFMDTSADALSFFLVTGVGPGGEGPKGHFGE